MREFKFKIGDLVYSRAGIHDCKVGMRINSTRTPIATMISERVHQECPGGVQLHYKLDNGASHLEESLCGVDSPEVHQFLNELSAYMLAARKRIRRESLDSSLGIEPDA